jgi:large subunit ribosomal protein L31
LSAGGLLVECALFFPVTWACDGPGQGKKFNQFNEYGAFSKADEAGELVAILRERPAMKANIHPKYEEVGVTCSCGTTFKTRSTHREDLRLDICSQCHPFYTGKQKVVDTGGRVDKFNKRFGQRKV